MSEHEVDQRLSALLHQIDRPVDMDVAARDRVRARMFAAADAQPTRDESVRTVVEVSPRLVRLDAPGAGSHIRDESRRRWLLPAVAATVVVALGVAASISRVSEPAPTQSQPADVSLPEPFADNILGYDEFTSVAFTVVDGDGVTQAAITDRVTSTTIIGTERALVIRRLVGSSEFSATSGPAQPQDADVRLEPDGAVIVPIEFIHPIELGGACTGGALRLELRSGNQSIDVRCNGQATDVDVSLATRTVDGVTALDIELSTDLGAPVTLWFDELGLTALDLRDGADRLRLERGTRTIGDRNPSQSTSEDTEQL